MSWKAVVRDGVGYAIPTVLLLGFISQEVGLNFGNLVFGVSIATALGWLLLLPGPWSDRSPNAVADNGLAWESPLIRLLVFATGVTGFGWLVALFGQG